jgi:hypothetical protein
LYRALEKEARAGRTAGQRAVFRELAGKIRDVWLLAIVEVRLFGVRLCDCAIGDWRLAIVRFAMCDSQFAISD